jgi:hypothetical protein
MTRPIARAASAARRGGDRARQQRLPLGFPRAPEACETLDGLRATFPSRLSASRTVRGRTPSASARAAAELSRDWASCAGERPTGPRRVLRFLAGQAPVARPPCAGSFRAEFEGLMAPSALRSVARWPQGCRAVRIRSRAALLAGTGSRREAGRISPSSRITGCGRSGPKPGRWSACSAPRGSTPTPPLGLERRGCRSGRGPRARALLRAAAEAAPRGSSWATTGRSGGNRRDPGGPRLRAEGWPGCGRRGRPPPLILRPLLTCLPRGSRRPSPPPPRRLSRSVQRRPATRPRALAGGTVRPRRDRACHRGAGAPRGGFTRLRDARATPAPEAGGGGRVPAGGMGTRGPGGARRRRDGRSPSCRASSRGRRRGPRAARRRPSRPFCPRRRVPRGTLWRGAILCREPAACAPPVPATAARSGMAAGASSPPAGPDDRRARSRCAEGRGRGGWPASGPRGIARPRGAGVPVEVPALAGLPPARPGTGGRAVV